MKGEDELLPVIKGKEKHANSGTWGETKEIWIGGRKKKRLFLAKGP